MPSSVRPPLRDVPHYVYRCWDAEGRLLYVGCTNNWESRHYGYQREVVRTGEWPDWPQPWFASVAACKLVGPFVGRDARGRALAYEREAIRAEAPLYNVHHNVQRNAQRRLRVVA